MTTINDFTRLGVLSVLETVVRELTPQYNLSVNLDFTFPEVSIRCGSSASSSGFAVLYLLTFCDDTPSVSYFDKGDTRTETYDDAAGAIAAFKHYLAKI